MAGAAGEDIVRVNPRDKTGLPQLFNPATQTWDTLTRPPSKGAHWIADQPMPQPKDTSAADAVRADREGAHVDQVRHETLVELNNRAKPVEDVITTVNKLNLSLDQNSNVGDSVVAEQVIRIMAGGPGSGIRMQQPLIDQVLKQTRTAPESFKLIADKYRLWASGDRKNPLILSDEQRREIYALGKAVRKFANDQHAKIIAYRRKIDSAESTKDIFKYATDAEEDLYAVPDEPAPPPPPTAKSLIDARRGRGGS